MSTVDFDQIAARMREAQQRLAAVGDELPSLEGVGYGGGGLVSCTAGGDSTLTALKIDPSILDPDDAQTVEQMVVEAVDAAFRALAEARAEHLRDVTDGLEAMKAMLSRPPTLGTVEPLTPRRR